MGWHGLLTIAGFALALWVHERMHARQLHALVQQGDEVRAAHQALLQTQTHMDDFVAVVGHELRTPMGAILGLNDVLRRELADRPQDIEVVDRIRQATEQLLQVADKMLEFSRLQTGKVPLYPEDFDLPDALRELMARHEAQAQHKGLAWQLQGLEALPQRVRMDRQRLQQVLDLLLDNALRHTAQGQVVLRVRLADTRLHCEVQDTGCGIPLARQATLFDAQTPGLGLKVCAQLVHLLGGELGVRSAPAQGIVFWLDLPLDVVRTPDPAPQADSAELEADAPLDILVVDDNEVNRMVARLQLQKIWPQARIAMADSAAQALHLLDTQGFDVALVDVRMPDMDGVALAQQIRQRFAAPTAGMPIIALTANTDAQERARCLAAGLDEVLYKPLDEAQLERCVSARVARAQGRAS
jgi:CheY-like chemotaxis protein